MEGDQTNLQFRRTSNPAPFLLLAQRQILMSYVLATTHSKVLWYKFSFDAFTKEGQYELLNELLNELDLRQVPGFSDKETAKLAANALGLKTWRYVKI